MDKLKSIYASAYSACISIAVIVVITIRMEFSPDFKTWLASFTGHHWVTKSWISILVFALCFCLFRFIGKPKNEVQTKRALRVLQYVSIVGFLTLLGFFVYEFFKH